MNEKLILKDALPLRAKLYNSTSVKNLELPEIADYLKEKKIFEDIEIREAFLKKHTKSIKETAEKIAKTRISKLETPKNEFETSKPDIKLEKELIKGKSKMTKALYDGFRLLKVFSDHIPQPEKKDNCLHVVYTDRFFATWKPATQRYHARISTYGKPSIISTTGIVDAPARPKGFYHLKNPKADKKYEIVGEKKRFEGQYVDYDDEKLTEIMKGYAMQAVFYQIFTGPFCDNNRCRLYNPHLQKNILSAQLTKPEFCEKHRKILEEMQDIAAF